jgi:hypothetical protein
MRVLYGLERLPKTLSVDDPRLPGIDLSPAPLRLNSIPLPAASWVGAADHDSRWAALEAWLLADCGDYNKAVRRAVSRYLSDVAAHITAHEDEIAGLIQPFAGLYRVQDWAWSALRPLPRAWWRQDGVWKHADIAFWDGAQMLTERPSLGRFWEGQTLPRNPFRRVLPTPSFP